MTKAQKSLVIKLLTGYHWRKSITPAGLASYRVYDSKSEVTAVLHARTVDTIDRFFDRKKFPIWKRSKDGKITLNLSTLRRIHGKHTLNCLYKDRDKLKDPGYLYKPRKKQNKKINNETIQYLF